MTIKDIATAAQNLANYCYREGEESDMATIEAALKLIGQRLTVLKQDRVSAMAESMSDEVLWGEA